MKSSEFLCQTLALSSTRKGSIKFHDVANGRKVRS